MSMVDALEDLFAEVRSGAKLDVAAAEIAEFYGVDASKLKASWAATIDAQQAGLERQDREHARMQLIEDNRRAALADMARMAATSRPSDDVEMRAMRALLRFVVS